MALGQGPRIAVLASGRGSNFEALAAAVRDGRLQAQIAVLASDRASAAALDKARALGIATMIEKDPTTLSARLRSEGIEWVVLAGYKKILTSEFITAFADPRGFSRIVNVHPSLLPSFPGLHSYEQAFNHGVRVTGVTVHLVDAGLDTGPICAQESFHIHDCATAEDVERRGLAIEHALYAQTLNWLFKNQFVIQKRGGRLHVQPR